MTEDEIAFRAAINVLRDSVESGRMPSGIKLEPVAAELHERAARHLETRLAEMVGRRAMADPPAHRAPFLAACRHCQHVWPIMWFPCDMELLRQVPPAILCPWCGRSERGNVALASREAGDLDRYAAWLETELERARGDLVETREITGG